MIELIVSLTLGAGCANGSCVKATPVKATVEKTRTALRQRTGPGGLGGLLQRRQRGGCK